MEQIFSRAFEQPFIRARFIVSRRVASCHPVSILWTRPFSDIWSDRDFASAGVQSRRLMSVDQMSKVAGKPSSNEGPSEALHETGGTGLVAFDDVSGQQLETSLMIKARADEIAYFREIGVYEKVSVS